MSRLIFCCGEATTTMMNLNYKKMCYSDNLRRMAAAGSRYGRIYFYKGFGMEHERADMEQAKRKAAIIHQLGMKVDLYVAKRCSPKPSTTNCQKPGTGNSATSTISGWGSRQILKP